MKRKSRSLRNQMTSLMVILVALQSIALVVALVASQVFSQLDAENFRLFTNTGDARAEDFNNDIGRMVTNLSLETDYLTGALTGMARQNGVAPGQLYLDDELYEQVASVATGSLLNLIGSNNITGAFLFLDGSNYDKEGASSHSAIYIRNSSPTVTAAGYSNYQVELGPASITQEYQIAMSERWAVSVQFTGETTPSFYAMPIWASEEYPGSDLQRYGYWTSPASLLGDGEEVITYTLPLLDQNGVAYGVVGFEISLEYFTQHFLPTSDLPYQDSFYIVANVEEDHAFLNWFIPGGTLASTHLENGEPLYLAGSLSGGDNIRETTIDSLGDMYASVHSLDLYSEDTPFNNVNWTLIAFVGKDVLHDASSGVRTLLMGSIFVTTAVALVAVVLLARFATRKIRGLSKHVQGVSGYEQVRIPRSGLGEVDELISAVEKLNLRVLSSSQRISKIMELTSMPIGGYEKQIDAKDVFVTEYIYDLLGLERGARITHEEWEEHYARLTAKPDDQTPNVFEYEAPGGGMWLRIVETGTDEGSVGIILDVSKEVEERIRLAHELDYDAMTGLYSRRAFKREAFERIKRAPDEQGAMVFADLDNLKYINDNYGHDVGDNFLRMAGDMFSRFAQMGGIVSRIAGDEFAIYFHGEGNTHKQIREALFTLMQDTKNYTLHSRDGKTHRIRFSAGIAWYPRDADNVSDLLKLADYAMYEAKHQRKGTLVEFNPDSYKENAYLLENRESISRLIDEELIRFDLQPIVDLHTGEVVAYEALMRSLIPDFKTPMEILSVAAAQGKLYQLERLVIFKSYALVNELAPVLGDKRVFINSLPSQRLSSNDANQLAAAFPEAMRHIVVEFTEDENSSIELMSHKVDTIRSMGSRIAVDDFGAGYSNELRILSLNPDYVKIDMGIIQGISVDVDKQHLTASIVSFCRGKNIRTIAEGVETLEDLQEVMRQNIDYVQGFFTGTPAEELQDVKPDAREAVRGLAQQHWPSVLSHVPAQGE